jgi:methylmalonyl-CoA carboxyltransferase large subunit
MTPETADSAGLRQVLDGLRDELRRLGERVAALEAAAGAKPPAPAPAPAPAPPAEAEGVSEEVLLVISAAIAAFLGKKPHIRQIRLLGTTAWSQQGRVTIQASHALSARHTRSAP